MAGSSDPLEERGDPVRRSDLTHQIHVPDVDAELERRGRDQRAQAAGLEPGLGVEARFFREAPVMRRDRVVADPIAQMTREALGHPPRVHENERRPMRLDERREPVVVLLPHFVRHHRFQRCARDLDSEIDRPAVTGVDDRAGLA